MNRLISKKNITNRIDDYALGGIFLLLILAAVVSPLKAQKQYEPWKVVSASDWHSAENGVRNDNPGVFERAQQQEHIFIRQTLAPDPDVVMIAGDMGGGRWVTDNLKGVMQPGETLEETIYRLGEKTYCNHRRNFLEEGMDKLMVSVGDHDVGDNDWRPGSERSQSVPWHRKIYGQCYNRGDNGEWLWDQTVGDVPARPLGTRYENTSFAYRHKNVLFVNVDIFHQEDPDKRLHPVTGSVIANITGDHLEWFDKVLEAGRNQEDIRYIFVQAHPPVLPPVRVHSSSMMYADKYENSKLWQTMRKHRVDLYFAGEVHAHTISKDPESDLVQVVTDRKMPVEIVVHDDRLEFRAFERDPDNEALAEKPNYFPEHRLTVDKSGPEVKFSNGSGTLKELNTESVFIHYPFEQIADTPFGVEKDGDKPDILNHGELDYLYDAGSFNAEVARGKLGNGVMLKGDGSIDVYGFCPFGFREGEPQRTFSFWFNTTQTGTYNLMNGGNGTKYNARSSGALDLVMHDGSLAVRTEKANTRASRQESEVVSASLNDGQWHHVALVVPPDANTIGDLNVYVDGRHRAWRSEVNEKLDIGLSMDKYRVAFGSTYAPIWGIREAESLGNGYTGRLDDVALWYRALSPAEMKAIYSLANANELAMDAGTADKLLKAYQQKESVEVQGQVWNYATGLDGELGELTRSGDRTFIRLDKQGNGVRQN